MQESDAIHLVCYMVLEYSGACVLHGTNKFWKYCDTMTGPMSFLGGGGATVWSHVPSRGYPNPRQEGIYSPSWEEPQSLVPCPFWGVPHPRQGYISQS